MKKPSSLDLLNSELEKQGIKKIKDVDMCPERTAYLEYLEIPFDERQDDWSKKLKGLKERYKLNFHNYFATIYPYLRYELSEDKTYWLYDEELGFYKEINFTTVRSLVVNLLIDEGLIESASEAMAKAVLNKYRAMYQDRASLYSDFDNDPEWFHAKNGWVNVKTLKFIDHTPTKLSKRVSAVDYDKKAKCPKYDKFLDEEMQLKPDQVKVIDQFSGLLLTPDITKQKMLVLIGKPGCGKSTLLDAWNDVLGDCATQSSLHEIASDSFRFGGSSLVGKQLCWFDEVEVTRSNMGNSLINLITGQYIRVERKGIDGIVKADNNLKCVLTANTLPRSAEMGIYRRMILIYLEYSFYENQTADFNIRQILKSEASGILNRMLRGLADLNKYGNFTMIEGHDELIEEYKTSSNTMSEFLDYHFEADETATPIKSTVLLEAYKNFSNDRYTESLTPQRFGMALKHHGLSRFDKIYNKKDRTGNKMWCGLRLKEEFEFNQAGFIREKEEF